MAVNQAICYLKDGLVATSQTGDLAMTISRQLSDLQSETTSEEARLDKLIDIQFSALPLFPRTPGIFSALGESYMSRYELHDQLSDLDKAIYYDDLAASIAAEQAHQSTPDLFHNVGISHQRRFRHSGQTEDIEKAVKFMTDAVACIPLGQPNLHLVLANLGNSHILRYRRSGRLEDIDLAIANQANAVGLVQNDVKHMAKHLGALGSSHLHRYRHQGEAPDIENAVEFQTVALSFLEHPVDPSLLANLALTYLARQEYDYGDLGDIETAIAL
ncbi:hypothetical protein FRC09_006434 [Ceratobasidium sp. 395]|nr:hypothetical protein FRC09_006434 [Ceratobasidium sp. 395]